MKTLNERATEILQALLAVRAYRTRPSETELTHAYVLKLTGLQSESTTLFR